MAAATVRDNETKEKRMRSVRWLTSLSRIRGN